MNRISGLGAESSAREALRIVLESVSYRPEDFVGVVVWRETRDVFETLVAVMLTQNTSDVNAFRALSRLRELLGGRITPESVLAADPAKIEDAIRPAGLARIRASRIVELARAALNGALRDLDRLSTEEARRRLLELPGVGEKTADVLLLNMGHPVFPVDTHIARIANRWGIGRKYKEISQWFLRELGRDPRRLLDAHLKLIQFGRDFCRARSPRCGECPARHVCPWPHKRI